MGSNRQRRSNALIDRLHVAWPVALMFAVTVFATAALIWFVLETIANEKLASRERMARAYGGYAEAGRSAIAEMWHDASSKLGHEATAPERFAKIIAEAEIDSVLIDDEGGVPLYPTLLPHRSGTNSARDARWASAHAAEFDQGRDDHAASEYARIADDSLAADRPTESAMARQAQIRCLLRSGDYGAAVQQFQEAFEHADLAHATDESGRSIRANTALAVFESLDVIPSEKESFGAELAAIANDYGDASLPASQRRFLMDALSRAGVGNFPTRRAEDLAARWLSGDTANTIVWRDAATGYRVLVEESTFRSRCAAALKTVAPDADATLALRKASEPGHSALASTDAGEALPGWRIDLELDEAALAEHTGQNVATYTAVGGAVVVALGLLTWLVARGIASQLRRAQIKHDLAATISHELRTPLASMRLLVDVLLEGEKIDENKAREYLTIIAGENERLTHLVENFLAYARIEKGAATPTATIAPREIIEQTAATIGRRYGPARVHMDIAPNLPLLQTDGEALKTALINLADNACKYSPESAPIKLRCAAREGGGCNFEVADSGAGMDSAELERAFRSFERLESDSSGCGLGLYIVQKLVERIGGCLEVSSNPGQGSRFNILLSPH